MANKSGSNFGAVSTFNPLVTAYLIDINGLMLMGTFTGATPSEAGQYQVGCVLIKTDGAGATTHRFANQGTSAAPSFVEMA